MTTPEIVPVPQAPVLAPEENIGPYYRNAGIFLLVMFGLTVGTFLVAILLRVPLEGLVVKVLAALSAGEMLSALLLILRPTRFDSVFRAVIAALPWTKFGSPPTEGSP